MAIVLEHEVVHFGAQANGRPGTVKPYQGNDGGELGQYFTDRAYGRTISWDRPEAGLAVYATFRTFAGSWLSCRTYSLQQSWRQPELFTYSINSTKRCCNYRIHSTELFTL